jgi:hypothetical protein
MESILIEIAKQGGFAFIAAVSLWFALKKDRQVSQLYDRLERKSEKYVEKYTDLSRELNDTVSALADALDLEVE